MWRSLFLTFFLFAMVWPCLAKDAPFVYVTNERTGAITVINSNTDQIVKTFQVHGRARGIQISRDGKTLFIAVSVPMGQLHATQDDQNKIIAMDATSGKILHRYDVGKDPERLVLTPDERRVIVANEDDGLASVYDLAKDQWVRSVVVGLQPEGVGVSPNGRWAYVTSEGSNCISVINAKKISVEKLVFVDRNPRDVVFLSNADRAYVACEVSGSVVLLNSKSHAVIQSIVLPQGSRPMSMALTPSADRLFVSNGRGNSVSAIDTRTNKVLTTIPTGSRTWGIAITPNGDKVYAANSLDKTVSVIDVQSLRVIRTIDVGEGSWGIAIPH
jgi:YVTN family beta-propeller protein